ncbi:MAG: hypothetical protein Fur0043_02580 [Anaerolineales bacterium]
MFLAKKSSRFRFRNWPVGARLLFSFGVLLLLILGLAATSLSSLLSIQGTVKTALGDGLRIQDLGETIQIDLVEARRQEQAFLLHWQEEGYQSAVNTYLIPHGNNLTDMSQSIAELNDLAAKYENPNFENLEFDLERLSGELKIYRTEFNAVTKLLEKKGTKNSGVIQALEETRQALLSGVSAMEQPELTRLMLQLQLDEQSYLLYNNPQDQNNVTSSIQRLHAVLSESPEASSLVTLLERHEASFDELVRINGEIDAHTQQYIAAADKIKPIAIGIAANGTEFMNDQAESVTMIVEKARFTFGVVVLSAIVLGSILAYVLGRQISRPIRQLTDAAVEIAQGNWQTQAPVESSDEIGMLSNAFNNMAGQMREMIETLEQRVADRTRALQVSTEVSRRLSTILDQQELVREVVEQVRSAFAYYHVHIYLLSEDGEELIMAGGTGEAGQAMLAKGHKILKGKGLVGRAAQANQPVLVPDTSEDPDWLPNPLLPETKSEIAVPIFMGGQVLGVLDVQHNIVGGLDQEDAALLQSISNQVAIALQNARAYEETQRRAQQEALMSAIGQKILGAVTVEDVLQVTARELGHSLGVREARVVVKLGE